MATIEFRGIAKTFPGGIAALSALDLSIGAGERFVVVGPSGSGKSTLLRLVAGLESPTAGTLWIGGRRADALPPQARDLAMVFQHPALYPHLSVFENLAFGLRARRQPPSEIADRVAQIASRLDLGDLLARLPRTLSGGQRQRVALGRALVRRPAAFLLDEPFSSLDAPLRAGLRAALVDLHREAPVTMLYVTHDQAEALALGNRIAVMDRGRRIQIGTPEEVYHRPATRFVAEFLGTSPMNVLPCIVDRVGEQCEIQPIGVDATWQVSWLGSARLAGPGRFDLGFRPERLRISDVLRPGELVARASVRRLEPLGHETIATVALGPHLVGLRLPPTTRLNVGEHIPLALDPSGAVWFDADTGMAVV